MHYKHKMTAKIKSTTTFYLPREILQKLDFIADFERQPRNRIVEVCVRFYKEELENARAEFKRVKRRFYKREKNTKRRTARKQIEKKICLAKGDRQNLFTDL